ncbi:kinase-like domain-containing protein [Hyaloraphidium curvatum]|nr:kinase-like domain-containing protein [Hyaloraphidium curvatum]
MPSSLPSPLDPGPTPAEFAAVVADGRRRRRTYRTLAILGSGSDGRVTLAERSDGLRVALKSTRKPAPGEKSFEVGFNMPWAMAALIPVAARCPHLPRVYDIFRTRSAMHSVWELLEAPLTALVERKGGSLSEAEAATVAKGALSALALLHGEGWLHRDVKPDNMMLRVGLPSLFVPLPLNSA